MLKLLPPLLSPLSDASLADSLDGFFPPEERDGSDFSDEAKANTSAPASTQATPVIHPLFAPRELLASLDNAFGEPMRWLWARPLISGPSLVLGALVLASCAWLMSEPANRTYAGVSVAGSDVGGRSLPDLRHALADVARKRATTPIQLVFAADDGTQRTLTLKPADIAPWERSPLPTSPFDVDTARARAYMEGRELNLLTRLQSRWRLRQKVNIALPATLDGERFARRLRIAKVANTTNASLVWTDTGAQIREGSSGLAVDPKLALPQITKALAQGQTTIQVAATAIKPKVSASDLVPISAIEASAVVRITASNPNAKINAQIAALTLQSVTVRPGETISLNNIIGERKESKGYKKASAFVNGKTVQDFGAGICYDSTAIYQAAMASHSLKVVEHFVHSRQVLYAAKGRDATLAWGFKDLKLKNVSSKSVTLMVLVKGKKVYARVMAAPTK